VSHRASGKSINFSAWELLKCLDHLGTELPLALRKHQFVTWTQPKI